MAKKETSKKAKKVKVSKVTPDAKKGEKKVKVPKGTIMKKAEVELVTFSVRMTIPIQQYGNVMPELVVQGHGLGIQEVIDYTMPFMEDMYQKYAEDSREGKKPKFFKGNVTVTEKNVLATSPQAVAAAAESARGASAPNPTGGAPVTPIVPKAEDKKPEAPKAPETAPEVTVERSAAFKKAANAIASAQTSQALDLLADQVNKSVKLVAYEKPDLITLILKKYKEVK